MSNVDKRAEYFQKIIDHNLDIIAPTNQTQDKHKVRWSAWNANIDRGGHHHSSANLCDAVDRALVRIVKKRLEK